MDYSQAIAAEIRAEQARRLWSRRELARRVAKPTTTVNRWLRAETPMTLDEIAAFAKALDVSTVDLVEAAMAKGSPQGGADITATGWYYVDSCADGLLDLVAA